MAEQTTDFIPCMLIPLKEHYLLLPNSTVAEVIPIPRLTPPINKPDFWVGDCTWHSKTLPVIDLESLVDGSSSEVDDANKLCVLHAINDEAKIGVYSLPCYGVPQLIHLNESALKLALDTEDSDFLHYQIKIGNKIAYIPNVDEIESIISQS